MKTEDEVPSHVTFAVTEPADCFLLAVLVLPAYRLVPLCGHLALSRFAVLHDMNSVHNSSLPVLRPTGRALCLVEVDAPISHQDPHRKCQDAHDLADDIGRFWFGVPV